MKTTKSKSAPMVGRRVKLSFPAYDTEAMATKSHKWMSRIDILKACLGHDARTPMPGSFWRIKHADEEAEIVNVRNDDGFVYSPCFPDGTIEEAYAHDFVMLPAKPESAPTWEYNEISLDNLNWGARQGLFDDAGKLGWELVAVTVLYEDRPSAFFKRPIL